MHSEEAFKAIYGCGIEEMARALLTRALSLPLRSRPHDAEDLVQRTMIVLLRYDPIEEVLNGKGFAVKVLINQWRNLRRLAEFTRGVSTDFSDAREDHAIDGPSIDSLATASLMRDAMETAIGALATGQRDVFRIRLGIEDGTLELKPFSYVAAALGINEAAARRRYADGLAKIRRMLDDLHRDTHDDEEGLT